MNTNRAQLHDLVDVLPEGVILMAQELLLATIKGYQMLEFQQRLSEAPYDDEPLSAEDIQAIEHAHLELSNDAYKSQAELMQDLGLC